ncbi:DUF2986 domain-containing protein [Moritella marina ATCC 15381]|uniref:DUF2986 domain-containing protein n=1 Tax=Moritella marina ATCC 15381 TaxID=1202962 RepID=A0A5J6WJY6_MORMI|nr:DUF2986 domain-containing protein [Moritella marina]QFI38393.1 DUF2986 domain-containing protein [Moritella marina ATCC 15381]
MNRKKKVVSTLKKKAKKANAKLAPSSNKPRYISKAEREKIALEAELILQENVLQERVLQESVQQESVQEELSVEKDQATAK